MPITITDEAARVCLQALGELPLKFTFNAFAEISNKLEAAKHAAAVLHVSQDDIAPGPTA